MVERVATKVAVNAKSGCNHATAPRLATAPSDSLAESWRLAVRVLPVSSGLWHLLMIGALVRVSHGLTPHAEIEHGRSLAEMQDETQRFVFYANLNKEVYPYFTFVRLVVGFR